MEQNHVMSATAQAIFNTLKSRKGQMGITIVTVTEPSMLGGKKNPFLGRVTKITTYKDARCGVSYKASVEGKMERKGIETPYQEGRSTTDFLNDILQVSKDGTKEYLKIGINAKTTTASVVIVDGIIVYTISESREIKVYDSKIYEALKPYIKPCSVSKRQQEHGLNADETIGWSTTNVENVATIAQGRVADGTYKKLYENAKYNHLRPIAA